ncbi:transcriptional regulator [Kocuria dechangensis]|uniref:Transcriptional regulator n=1 Tax=Kocuria dechangensis TaxID=1176249 RepID=A0A917LZ57_9MICC|nr:GAF and ANTAR domain-containing protein [Kocuria dechangensis]GGG67386.1 transcriptional regulator [Kocuria dechangensis]
MEPDPAVAGLSAAVARVHEVVLHAQTAAEAVSQLVEVAQQLIPLAAGAGISLVDEDGVCTTVAATDPVVAEADALQYELGEGPCLRAWDTVSIQYVPDTTTDLRWPTWSQTVAAAGIRSALSVPLVVQGQEIGALQVYATEPHAFTGHEEHLLSLLAGPAAALLGAARTRRQTRRLDDTLQEAVADRDRIERAVGVLMERGHLAESTARTRLLNTARAQGKTLAQAADHLLDDTDPPA